MGIERPLPLGNDLLSDALASFIDGLRRRRLREADRRQATAKVVGDGLRLQRRVQREELLRELLRVRLLRMEVARRPRRVARVAVR
jgi:hypothetical protein